MDDVATYNGLLELPSSPAARAAVDLVRRNEPAPVANHSVRSYLFARLLAAHRGVVADWDYDPELLYFACVLHDIGLSKLGNREQRFEVDGADVAAEFLLEHGFGPESVDTVWEAIALHTSSGIAERRGIVCQLTRAGVGVDFGRDTEFVTARNGALIHRAYPRLAMETSLVDEIVNQGRGRPDKAPRYSIAGELVRERTVPPYTTSMEQQATSSRWASENYAQRVTEITV